MCLLLIIYLLKRKMPWRVFLHKVGHLELFHLLIMLEWVMSCVLTENIWLFISSFSVLSGENRCIGDTQHLSGVLDQSPDFSLTWNRRMSGNSLFELKAFRWIILCLISRYIAVYIAVVNRGYAVFELNITTEWNTNLNISPANISLVSVVIWPKFIPNYSFKKCLP